MPTVLLVHCDGAFVDVSPSAHVMTTLAPAAITTTQIKFGSGALVVPGGAIQTAASADFDFLSAPFTIEAWVYASSAAGTAAIVAQFSNASGGGWYFGTVGGNMVFWGYDATGTRQQVDSTTVIPTGAWHFVAVDRDAGGMVRVYLDGVVVASRSVPTFQSAMTVTNIGNSNIVSTPWSNGYIDEVRITKGTALYAGPFTPPTGPFGGVAATTQARAMVMA